MPKPAYAFVGPDSLLQVEGLTRVLKELPSDVQRVDFDGEIAELADVLDELRSYSMFSTGKIVVVRNGDKFLTRYREQLEDYLADPCDSGILVLRLNSLPSNQRIYKSFMKVGVVEKCEPPKDLAKWIIGRAKSVHQMIFAPDAARLLADYVGDDLARLDNEIAKLALGADKNHISADMVSGGVVFQRERDMWDMTNALGEGNVADAMRRWRQLLGANIAAEFRAVTWLGLWLEKVVNAQRMLRDGQSPFEIFKALRIWPPDIQQPFIETVKSIGPAAAKRAVDLLAEIDFQSKTGVGDTSENIERFMLSLASLL